MIFERDPHRLFGVPRAHRLKLLSRTVSERGAGTREVRWFLECDADGAELARYRCWDERTAPGRTTDARRGPARELGWERYGPRGELLDREVRRARDAHESVTVH